MNFTLNSPEAMGVSSKAITDFLKVCSGGRMHSFIMLRNGKCISEAYFKPYSADKTHMLFSLSKSFTSMACCFAIADGLISPDDYIEKFFPDKIICSGMKKVKLHHLLTMSCGQTYSCDKLLSGPDWIQNILASEPDRNPGEVFSYNTSSTYLVSVIVSRATGRSLDDYLGEKLLRPLDITDVHWDRCPAGYCQGGFGFNIKTRDIAKLGQFLLQDGMWDGKQLLPVELIRTATSKHISNGTPVPGKPSDWQSGYGWKFWRCEPDGVFRGDGAHGQFCIVLPKQNAVIAITAGTPDMQGILTLIWQKLLPAISPDSLKSDEAAESELRKLEAECAIPTPDGNTTSKTITGDFGNPLTITTGESETVIDINPYGCPYKLRVGHGEWLDNGGVSYAGAWNADGSFHLREVHNRTPFVRDIILRCNGEKIKAEISSNVSFGGEVELWYNDNSIFN